LQDTRDNRKREKYKNTVRGEARYRGTIDRERKTEIQVGGLKTQRDNRKRENTKILYSQMGGEIQRENRQRKKDRNTGRRVARHKGTIEREGNTEIQ
jgi:hypothetical protein